MGGRTGAGGDAECSECTVGGGRQEEEKVGDAKESGSSAFWDSFLCCFLHIQRLREPESVWERRCFVSMTKVSTR